MDAATLVRLVRLRGVELSVRNGQLCCWSRGQVPDDLVALLRHHKAGVMEVLAEKVYRGELHKLHELLSNQIAKLDITTETPDTSTVLTQSVDSRDSCNPDDPTTQFLMSLTEPPPGSVSLLVRNGKGELELIDAAENERQLELIRQWNAQAHARAARVQESPRRVSQRGKDQRSMLDGDEP